MAAGLGGVARFSVSRCPILDFKISETSDDRRADEIAHLHGGGLPAEVGGTVCGIGKDAFDRVLDESGSADGFGVV